MYWVLTAYVTKRAGILIITVLQALVATVSVVLLDIAVTADAYHVHQDKSLVKTVYVIHPAAVPPPIAKLAARAVMESVVLLDIAVTADVYHAHLAKSLVKTVCVILPVAVQGTAR